MGDTYNLSLDYPEMLFLGEMIDRELNNLKRLCDKYKRYTETDNQRDIFMEKLMVSQGQLDSLQSVQQRLLRIIAVCKIETIRI